MQHVSQELEDLVKICTYANRQLAGGLVWLSWCGLSEKSRGRKTVPAHGSTLVAVTSWFVRQLLIHFDKLEFIHFDIALRNVMQSPPPGWFWCKASISNEMIYLKINVGPKEVQTLLFLPHHLTQQPD